MCAALRSAVYILTYTVCLLHLAVHVPCVGVIRDASLLSMVNKIVMVAYRILYHLPCN